MNTYKISKAKAKALEDVLSRVTEDSKWPDATGKGLVVGVVLMIGLVNGSTSETAKKKAIRTIKELGIEVAERYIPWPDLWASV